MRRPTELKSQKAASTRQRRRRGSTSPPLVGVETNPGPHQKKSTRRAAKPAPAPLDHNFTEQDKTKLQQLLDEGLTIEEIMRRTRWTKETVIRWSVRYQDTGKMETRKRLAAHPNDAKGKKLTSAPPEVRGIDQLNVENRWMTAITARWSWDSRWD